MIKAILEYFKNSLLNSIERCQKIKLKARIDFWKNFLKDYSTLSKESKVLIRPNLNQPESHTLSKHYFNQDFWVAQQIMQQKPNNHADIGSRIDGFVGHIACHRTIDFYDIIKPNLNIPNILEFEADLISGKGLPNNQYDSISCLHVLEHLGLGRYDNIIDHKAYAKGIEHLADALKPEGLLYLSVPCSGTKRIEYSRHHVFNPSEVLQWGNNQFDIQTLCMELDSGEFQTNIHKDEFIKKLNQCWYGLGIIVLKKK